MKQNRSCHKTVDDPVFQEMIVVCMEWFRKAQITKSMNRSLTSYGLKHIIERELDNYIANGCLIAAVILMDIPYVQERDSTNVYLPISEKTIKRSQRIFKLRRN